MHKCDAHTDTPLWQVFGWDFLLDEEMNCWVIEVLMHVGVCARACVCASVRVPEEEALLMVIYAGVNGN